MKIVKLQRKREQVRSDVPQQHHSKRDFETTTPGKPKHLRICDYFAVAGYQRVSLTPLFPNLSVRL